MEQEMQNNYDKNKKEMSSLLAELQEKEQESQELDEEIIKLKKEREAIVKKIDEVDGVVAALEKRISDLEQKSQKMNVQIEIFPKK